MPFKSKIACGLSVISFFLLLFPNGLSAQKITTNEILYSNYLQTDTVITDSAIQSAVRALVGDNTSISQIPYETEDSSYYAAIKNLLFILPQKQLFEINLYSLEKKSDGYLLKCMVSYGFRDLAMNNFVGFIKLPFVVIGGKIKFQNYFVKYYLPGLSQDKGHRIFTTQSNSQNLHSIAEYNNAIRIKYGLADNPNSTLVYVYDSINKNPYQAVGIENYLLSFQGMLISFGNYYIIFDKEGGGCYKHELVHYVSAGKFPYKFFNEGFASYVAGSSSKCDNKCDYSKLLDFLETHQADTGVAKILSFTGIEYGKYYYPFASFTVYLMAQKLGSNFLLNQGVQAVINTKSKDDIISYIHDNLINGEKSIVPYYIRELKNYLDREGGNH